MIGRLKGKKKLLIIIPLVLLLVGIGVAVWYFFLMPKTDTDTTSDTGPQAIVADEQTVERAREIVGIAGTLVSIEIAKKQITITDTLTQQLVAYTYDDASTAHVGVSAEAVKLTDIPIGQAISITYDSSAKVIMDIWYEAAQ